MNLTRRIRRQLVAFVIIAIIATAWVFIGYVNIPAMLGFGRYTVKIDLASTGNLYPEGNVIYSGTEVGRVKSVDLTEDGHVQAVLSMKDGVKIPSDLTARVLSYSAVGEQYVSLQPRDPNSRPLKDGDVIAMKDTVLPVPIDKILDDTTRGLDALPRGDLKTAVDESYVAYGGLGPEMARLVGGATRLAIDARASLGELTNVIDSAPPVLQSQIDSGGSIQSWAASLRDVTASLRSNDTALAGVLDNGAQAAGEAQKLLERIQPTLPVIMANLVNIEQIAITYQAGLEQLLVLVPQGVVMVSGGIVPNMNNPHPMGAGGYLDFNLNINTPPPCATGFLPASQRRSPAQTDAPARLEGLMYCRIPQDAPANVRGARNTPCATRPGKRAATAKQCELDLPYIPLNDGTNWKGDPNATLSGQDVPQFDPGMAGAPTPAAAPAAPATATPAVAIAQYDPSTGAYIGPDGNAYTQGDLAGDQRKDNTWQGMLVPPQ